MKSIQEFISNWFLTVIVAIIIIAGVVLNNYIEHFQTINFSSFDTSKIIGLIGSLFFISLLVERFLEIFVQDPKAKQKVQLQRNVRSLAPLGDIDQLLEAEAQLEQIKNERRRTLRVAGFAAGIVIALFGFRVLSNLLVEPIADPIQNRFVTIMDMVLTAGLVSGGSGGIHNLVNVLDRFMIGGGGGNSDNLDIPPISR